MVGQEVKNLLNKPEIICCSGCKRPMAVCYELINCIMWCFDCAEDIEEIATYVGIRITDDLIDKIVQAQHNNIWETCGYVYNAWKPRNNIIPEYENEATVWGTNLTVTQYIAKLETK